MCEWYNSVTYFDSFDVEHIAEDIKRFIGNNNIVTYIFRIQACDSIMCEDNFVLDLLVLYSEAKP